MISFIIVIVTQLYSKWLLDALFDRAQVMEIWQESLFISKIFIFTELYLYFYDYQLVFYHFIVTKLIFENNIHDLFVFSFIIVRFHFSLGKSRYSSCWKQLVEIQKRISAHQMWFVPSTLESDFLVKKRIVLKNVAIPKLFLLKYVSFTSQTNIVPTRTVLWYKNIIFIWIFFTLLFDVSENWPQ